MELEPVVGVTGNGPATPGPRAIRHYDCAWVKVRKAGYSIPGAVKQQCSPCSISCAHQVQVDLAKLTLWHFHGVDKLVQEGMASPDHSCNVVESNCS